MRRLGLGLRGCDRVEVDVAVATAFLFVEGDRRAPAGERLGRFADALAEGRVLVAVAVLEHEASRPGARLDASHLSYVDASIPR